MDDPLLHASRHDELYEYLQNWGDNWNWENEHGENLLHYACMGDNPEVVKFLISHGLDVNCQTKAGVRPIHYACIGAQTRVLEVLCINGADLGGVDPRTKLNLYQTLTGWIKEYSGPTLTERAENSLAVLRKFLYGPSVN